MCLTRVSIFDARLLLVLLNVWFFRFCFSFFYSPQRLMDVLAHRLLLVLVLM